MEKKTLLIPRLWTIILILYYCNKRRKRSNKNRVVPVAKLTNVMSCKKLTNNFY